VSFTGNGVHVNGVCLRLLLFVHTYIAGLTRRCYVGIMNSVVVKSAAEDAGIRPSTSVLELETNRHLHRRKSDRNGDSSRSRSRNVSASRSRNRSRAVSSFFGDDNDSSDDTGREKSAVEIA
jgi:hypothetical protein